MGCLYCRVKHDSLLDTYQASDGGVQGLPIMVFITENEASLHAVNLAVALVRPDIDSIHVMHACSNDGATPDAQKLMARLTQGLGPKVNSEVMVSHHMYCITCCTEPRCIMHMFVGW